MLRDVLSPWIDVDESSTKFAQRRALYTAVKKLYRLQWLSRDWLTVSCSGLCHYYTNGQLARACCAVAVSSLRPLQKPSRPQLCNISSLAGRFFSCLNTNSNGVSGCLKLRYPAVCEPGIYIGIRQPNWQTKTLVYTVVTWLLVYSVLKVLIHT